MNGQPPPSQSRDRGRQPPVVPDHRLLRRIGAGGAGEVWLAQHTTLNEFRAIKFVWRDVIEGASFFEREVEGVRCFEPMSREHEGLVDILQVSVAPDGQGFYYIMELADDATIPYGTGASKAGTEEAALSTERLPQQKIDADCYSPRTLLGEVRRRQRLPPREVLEIGVRLADALAKLHFAQPRPLVHRDVKPGNVVFVNGQPKLADPGLVMYGGEAHSLFGTPGFIPPEGPGTPGADIYSLGKTLYFMATGMPVERFPELPPDDMPPSDKAIWKRLNDVICKACDKDPAQRYRNGRELLEDLQRIQIGRRFKRRRGGRRVTLAGLAITAVAATALVSVLIPPRDHPRERLLLDERFDSPELDTNRWHPGQFVWSALSGAGTKAYGLPPYLTNRTLVIESATTSEKGLSIEEDTWVESVGSLRDSGETGSRSTARRRARTDGSISQLSALPIRRTHQLALAPRCCSERVANRLGVQRSSAAR